MTDLAGFLLARIAEDEAEAPMALGPCDCAIEGFPLLHGIRCIVPFLADREAKRRIVDVETSEWVLRDDAPRDLEYEITEGLIRVRTGGHTEDMAVDVWQERYWQLAPPSTVLRLLTLPYTDHPDYDQAWRP